MRNLYQVQKTAPTTLDADESSWEFHYQNLLNSMQGTLQEKEDVIRKRILRYFGEFKLEKQSFFCLRNDPDITNPYCELIQNRILLFGADYFSIKRAQQYFSGFFAQIKRIDDSHLIINFQNEKDCLAALNQNNLQKKCFSSPSDVLQGSQNGWILMNGYKEFIFERELMARYVTNLDNIQENKYLTSKNGLYFAYSEAKKTFLKNLQENSQSARKNHNFCSNMRRNNGRRGSFQSRSRSRSKQMNKIGEQGHCCCNCKNSLVRKRKTCFESGNNNNFIDLSFGDEEQMKEVTPDKRRYSGSSTDSRRSNYSLDRYSRRPAILQSMRTQDIENKFDQYLKKRDQNSKKTTSTSSPSQVDLEMDIPCSQDQNDTLMEFEQVLQRMRLDDSRHEYSAFDIEEEVGKY